jgi:hypothetical protein
MSVLYATIALLAARLSSGQLSAPTALSDVSGCFRNTCIWVPFIKTHTFRHREYFFTVDTDSNGDEAEFILRRGKSELLRTALEELTGSVSVVWSPDGHSLAVTWSDGGAIGGFHVRAFKISPKGVRELPVGRTAFDDFKARHWCEERGNNIQAYGWLPDSRPLVLVLSVYPTSDCGPELGHTEGYVVDAPSGSIEERWNLKRLNRYIRMHPEL